MDSLDQPLHTDRTASRLNEVQLEGQRAAAALKCEIKELRERLQDLERESQEIGEFADSDNTLIAGLQVEQIEFRDRLARLERAVAAILESLPAAADKLTADDCRLFAADADTDQA